MSLNKINAYKCEGCGEISESFEDEPLYECSSCGTNFLRSNSDDGDSHRCPNCHKFGSKIADNGCSSCQENGIEEISAVKCSDCDEIFEDTTLTACPNCEEIEMNKKELKRIEKLPIEQRGGQKTFANLKEAEIAYKKFINSIESEHISLSIPPNHDYDKDSKQKDGIAWVEFPKPYVSFHFEVKLTIHDKYLKEDYLSLQGLNELFYSDVEKSAKEHLKGEIHWNNSAIIGWVYIEK